MESGVGLTPTASLINMVEEVRRVPSIVRRHSYKIVHL
jgi:hypothetical protein